MTINFIVKDIATYNCEINTVIPFSGSIRRCRFCKKSEADGVSFKNKAHAISEALGNHNLVYEEECDSCNQNLSKIEQHLVNLVSPLLSTYGIKSKPKKGKDDIRGINAPSFKLENKNSLYILYLDKDLSNTVFGTKIAPKEPSSFDFSDKLKWHSFVPANVYRTICKYVVSTAPSEYLWLFDKTIEWINGSKCDISNCLVLYSTTNESVNNPRIMSFIFQAESEENFFVFAFLRIANLLISFEVPLTCNSQLFSKAFKTKIFMSFIQKLNLRNNFKELDLSSEDKSCMEFKFTLDLDPSLVEGKDIFTIDSKESIECLMAKESKLWDVTNRGHVELCKFMKDFCDNSKKI